MFLSRITLDPRSRDARRDTASNYELHCTLERAFAHAPKREGEPRRFLFRCDVDRRDRLARVFILSRTTPDLSTLPHGYCLQVEGPKPYEPRLAVGQQLAFRLLANPTLKRAGKRVKIVDSLAQEAWLRRKLVEAGAELLGGQANEIGLLESRKHPCDEAGESDERQQFHFAVLFEGILRVTDPVKLRAAIESGIGSAKGYGFGLLSLAPAG